MAIKAALTICFLLPAFAVAAPYDFDDPNSYLSSAEAMSSWAETLTKHAQQRDDLLACRSERGCKGRLKSFNRMMARSQALSDEEKIELANFYINRNNYDDDRIERIYDENGKKTGVIRSQWMTLYDFLTKGGDCEDYATSKYFMLRELGIAAEDMRVVVVFSRELRGYHAVLAVQRPDGATWLLDSDNVVRKKRHIGYRYIFAINENSIWDHREDFAGSAR